MSKKIYDQWVRNFNVSEPILHKKGYTLYKVVSKVFPKNSIEAETQVTVWKRYNDFKKLHKALLTIHQNLHFKDTFPVFAKARFFGRFDENVIAERQNSALELLEFAAKHPPLFTSQVFVKFFEDSHPPPDNYQPNEASNEIANVLQPVKNEPFASASAHQFAECGDSSSQSENTECGNSLGGIWMHRQAADNISISSHATEGDDDEDDRTTFTDDDRSMSITPLDLCEFDPLFDGRSKTDDPFKQNELCNSWLLSALQSCAQNSPGRRRDTECSTASGTLEFPTPFGDLEDPELPCDKTLTNLQEEFDTQRRTDESLDNKCPLPIDLEEFDPLSSKEKYCNVFEDISVGDAQHDCRASSSSQASQGETDAYIVKAAKLVGEAQEAEIVGMYSSAFSCYKTAIDILLLGVQKDISSSTQKEAVRRKIFQYLMRAEEIYENHLTQNLQPAHSNQLSATVPLAPTVEVKSLMFRGSLEDLCKFKVLGILHKVLLVMDVSTNRTYVVKTLPKSPSPVTKDVPNIVPQDIPFMVQLYQVYETCFTFFLILQYASGGRVWDYVSSYLHRSPISPCNENSQLFSENRENIYSGKKLHSDSSSEDCEIATEDSSTLKLVPNSGSADPDLTPSEKCPSSYIALFQTYAAYSSSQNKVSLAKCSVDSEVPVMCPENSYCFITDDHSQKNIVNTISIPCNQQRFNSENDLDSCVFKEQVNNYDFYSSGKDSDTSVSASKKNLISSARHIDKLNSDKISNNCNDVDILISNSEALIKNVDLTLNCGSNRSKLDEPTRKSILKTNSSGGVNSNSASCELTSCPSEPKFADLPTETQCASLPNSNLLTSSELKSGESSNKLKKMETGKLKKQTVDTGENVPKPSHHVDGRSRLSSSTGSLEVSSTQRVNFTELFHKMDLSRSTSQPAHLPESCVRLWAAQIVVALHNLHCLGVIWQDLHPDNLLLGREGDILLTYKSQWNCVDQILSNSAKENLYAAPEIGSIYPVTSACDWWSLGAVLFELLTGRSLSSCHPCGISSHTSINVPPGISIEATDLLKKLLKFNAPERLGAGPLGPEEIRAHPFFNSIYWESLQIRR